MNNIRNNAFVILLVFFSFKSAYPQSLSVPDLVKGEIYVLKTMWTGYVLKAHEHIVKFEDAEIEYPSGFGAKVSAHRVYGSRISIIFENEEIKFLNYHKSTTSFTTRTFQSEWSSIRHATQEEKDWLNACVKAGKFIPKEEVLKNNKQENAIADSQTASKKNIDYTPKERTEEKYDAFGNPVNSISSNQSQPKTDSKEKTNYDAFENPIKVNSQNTTSQTGNSKPATQQKRTNQTQDKVYFLAYAFNRNVGGCSIKINDYVGYTVYEGQRGDYMKAVEAVKAKYPGAEEYSASDFYPGKNFVLLEVYLLERPFSKSEGSCKRTAYEMVWDSSLEEAMSKINKRYGTSIIHTKVLVNKTF